MKTLLLTLLFPVLLVAGEQTITMSVGGSCGMCKKRIQKAASSVDGVSKATWDKQTKLLTVVMDDTKATKAKITTAVLQEGYDVDSTKASTEQYSKLPDCCKYRE